MGIKKDYEFVTNQGCKCKVLKFIKKEGKYNTWLVEFQDKYNYKKIVRQYSINSKSIKNPFYKSCYNIGYIGTEKTIKHVWEYWAKMIERCYSKYQDSFPTYKDYFVCEEWHNYKNFEKWFLEESDYKKGYCLDKDILIKGNKIYSPNTCCFVPSRINGLFTKRQNSRGDYPIGIHKRGSNFRTRCYTIDGGINNLGTFNTPEEAFYVYKQAKEKLIKEVADKYKDEISNKVYQAMYNYIVEITD